jgi:hypothetical protein
VPRTAIVGDVHGCYAELCRLIEKIRWASGDRLIFVGDLVARGPDGRRVLALARELGAESVAGNHDLKLLERSSEVDPADRALLASLPLWLDLPEHGLRVVHAGVMPGVPIEQQDPWVLTHIRSLDEQGQPSSARRPPLWAERYTGPPHVVFGHDALTGLQLHDWATGLDTACVYGERLSALVLDEGEPVPPKKLRKGAIVSVRAKRRYYVPGSG